MKIDRKQILLDALKRFRAFFDAWLAGNPDRELLQIAHSQLGKMYSRIDRAMKTKKSEKTL